MTSSKVSLKDCARMIFNLLETDRDAVLGVGGFTGEGKSTFVLALIKEYYKVLGRRWSYNLMTWSRKELLTWIDGVPGSKTNDKGLKDKQLAEYSGVVADELFSMFYRRNWFDNNQIDAIATFNMCRDRHLFIAGNVPNFWDLDTAFTCRVRFYAYIPRRGVAWIFEQENNPFSKDPWNLQENRKLFRKMKNPYKCPNFLFEIDFPDLDVDEKKLYLEIRNTKRREAIQEVTVEKQEKYGVIKAKRDAWLKLALQMNRTIKAVKGLGLCVPGLPELEPLTFREFSELTGDSPAIISMIDNGIK